VIERKSFYIGGEWIAASDREPLTVVDPSTEQALANVPAGTEADVNRAVAAARGAFESWSGTPVEERARLLRAAADALEARTEEVAGLITQEMGSPLAFSIAVQVGNPVRVLRSFADLLGEYSFEEKIQNSPRCACRR
jgi:acyl-CoA reductase-like NAD-dependent aldehyde dehydrogenase